MLSHEYIPYGFNELLKKQAYGVLLTGISKFDENGDPLPLSQQGDRLFTYDGDTEVGYFLLEKSITATIPRFAELVITQPDGSYPLVIRNWTGNIPYSDSSLEGVFVYDINTSQNTPEAETYNLQLVYPEVDYPPGSLLLPIDWTLPEIPNVEVYEAIWHGNKVFGQVLRLRNLTEGTAEIMISLSNSNGLLDENQSPSFFTPGGPLHFHQEAYPWKMLWEPIKKRSMSLPSNASLGQKLSAAVPIRTRPLPTTRPIYYGEQPPSRTPSHAPSTRFASGLTPHQRAVDDRVTDVNPNMWPPFIAFGKDVTTSDTPLPNGPILYHGRPAAEYYFAPVAYELKPYELLGHELEVPIFWTGDLRYDGLYTAVLKIESHPAALNKITTKKINIQLRIISNEIQSVDFINIEDLNIFDYNYISSDVDLDTFKDYGFYKPIKGGIQYETFKNVVNIY